MATHLTSTILHKKLTLQTFFCKHSPNAILHPKQRRDDRSLQTLQEGTWAKDRQARSAASLPLVGVRQPCLFYTFSFLLTNRQQKKQCPKRGEPSGSVWGAAGTGRCCQASQNGSANQFHYLNTFGNTGTIVPGLRKVRLLQHYSLTLP